MQDASQELCTTVKTAKIEEFLNPRFIFLPIRTGFKLKVKDGDYVYKNSIVALNQKGEMLFSTVSGRILGLKDMEYASGKKIPSLVIENDFKENIRMRKSARKFINRITLNEFFRALEDTSLNYKGDYFYKKLRFQYDKLIINAIDLEPEFKNKYCILKNNIESILEASDLIAGLLKIEKIIIALKNNSSDIINTIMNLIGTYPNMEIKLVSEEYPNGMDEILRKNLDGKYSLILGIEEIYELYEVIKRTVPVSEKFISIVGAGVKNNKVLKVKQGTLFSEVFIATSDFAVPLVDVYLNGKMHGKKINTLNFVIDTNVDGIYVDIKNNKKVNPCISCGLCSKCCPLKLDPKYVFDHRGKVKPEYYETCLQCGLCTSVCPSNIDLRSYMKGEKL